MFLRSAGFRKDHDFHTKNGIQQGNINFHVLRILLEKLNFAEMGPRAPKSPKKGYNSIGFIRPGAFGPRGAENAKKLRELQKYFCIFSKIPLFLVNDEIS